MAVNSAGAGQLVGVVSSVNPKGIKLDGQADWLNFSKFAADLVPPQRGARVAVTLDGSGFVRAIAPAGEFRPDSGRNSGAETCTDSVQVSRDQTITRLAVLKAAAEFCASRPELKSGDVLRIAESWEHWVTRKEGESHG